MLVDYPRYSPWGFDRRPHTYFHKDIRLFLHELHVGNIGSKARFTAAGSTSTPELIRQVIAWTDDANLVVDKSSVHLRNFNLWHVTAHAVLSAYGTRRTRMIAYRLRAGVCEVTVEALLVIGRNILHQ